jgi:hypothetical protein
MCQKVALQVPLGQTVAKDAESCVFVTPVLSVYCASLTLQPHAPGAVLSGSLSQLSLQFAVPSPSVSVSATPQPHAPGAVFRASEGQKSSFKTQVFADDAAF